VGEGGGIPGVAVKCVDIGRNISGEGFMEKLVDGDFYNEFDDDFDDDDLT